MMMTPQSLTRSLCRFKDGNEIFFNERQGRGSPGLHPECASEVHLVPSAIKFVMSLWIEIGPKRCQKVQEDSNHKPVLSQDFGVFIK